MTAHQLPPTHLLTIGEYAALGQDERGRTELQEGSLVMSPSPVRRHMKAVASLVLQLDPQLPDHLEVIPELDIDLELAAPDQPGSSRRPDLILSDRSAGERFEAEGSMVRASAVAVVIEVMSAGSQRMDNVTKRAEYADAGIPNYWIVDIENPTTLVACRLSEEFGYVDDGAVTGVFTASHPFEVTIDLDTP